MFYFVNVFSIVLLWFTYNYFSCSYTLPPCAVVHHLQAPMLALEGVVWSKSTECWSKFLHMLTRLWFLSQVICGATTHTKMYLLCRRNLMSTFITLTHINTNLSSSPVMDCGTWWRQMKLQISLISSVHVWVWQW